MDSNEMWGQFFDVSDVLSSTLDPATGTLTIQLGDVTKGRADSNKAEVWQGASGVCSRPALPTQGKASCQCLHLKRSDHDMGFAYRDLRATSIYGNLSPGDTCLYATSGAALAMCRAKDGSSRLMTNDTNAATGRVVFAGVSSYYTSTDGQRHLGGEWRRYAPWGGEWHDQNGYHFRHWTGIKIDAGGFAMPAPFSQNVATYQLTAGMVTIQAGIVALGTNDGTGEAVTKAVSLQTLMQSYAADLATFTTALGIFAAALTTYTQAIQGTADPTPPHTPTITIGGACTTLTAAASTFAGTVSALMATLATVAGAKSTTAT
jgi:hypothetical protein